jgi:hypothetical protein
MKMLPDAKLFSTIPFFIGLLFAALAASLYFWIVGKLEGPVSQLKLL